MHIHRIKNNESVYDVALEYSVSPSRLAYDNELECMRNLADGRELLVLTPTRTYTVKKGDTLEKIALRFGTDKERIKTYNPELMMRDNLYSGQLLVIKTIEPKYGMGIANGYYYIGCPRDMLARALPYVSYITVCSAVAEGGKIRMMHGAEEALNEAKKHGKIPMLRIYIKDDTDVLSQEFIDSATLLAKSSGYDGITLSRKPNEDQKDKLLSLKRTMIERDLLLFVEKDLEDTASCTEYADASVLTYDKLTLDPIPTFKDGEMYYMTEYSNKCNPEGAFIDLSAFSVIGGKYVEKMRAAAIANRTHTSLCYDESTMTLSGKVGRGRNARDIRTESLENTKAKLELVSELGYLGISFDIMRTPLSELLMFASMYTRPPRVKRRSVCNPD